MQKTSRRVFALVLSLILALSVFSISASAYNANYQSETHTVFKHYTQTLAPGVEYYNNYAYLSDGEQVVYYAAVADINRDDVLVQGSYWNAQTEQYGMAKLTEQVASANAKFSNPDDPDFISENYTVVAGTNGDFYNMQTGRPSGAFAINGHVMNTANNRPWFAVFEDGTALCGANDTDYNAAIAAHGAVLNSVAGDAPLVLNGEDYTPNLTGSAYQTERHSRSMIGVTADNKVVCMTVDGRQSPFSIGATYHELAQIMLEAECVMAINLDGGGSATFGARPEGEDSFRVINRPSDGSERSISSGIVIASLAAPTSDFDHVSIKVADDYVTPGTSTTFTADGVSASGAAAEIPAEVTYEAVNGTIDGNTVTASATGNVVINAKYNGNTVGTATFNAVIPDSIEFAQATFTVPYGKTMDLGIVAKYGLNEVVTKPADFEYTLDIPQDAGQIVDGAMVAPAEGAEAAANIVTATLIADNTKTTTANIAFGKASQVIFDFEDGTTQKWYRYNTNNYNYIKTRGYTYNVTAENGQVHSGEHALKIEAKFSETWEAGYVSGRAGVYGMDEIIDLKGATRLGMWMYIPIANASFNGRIFLCRVTERDEETGAIKNYNGYYTDTKIDQGGDWNCGFTTQYDEPGWHYVYFDLSPDYDWCIIKNAVLLDFYINDRNGDAYGYNHLNRVNENADLNLYIDDVTVDYSSVVEDRDAPVFSEVKLGDDGNYSNEGLVLARGSNYTSDGYNRIDLSARVADYAAANATGLNASSAKVYLDGVEFPCTFANGIITAPTYTYTNGKHTVKFAIKDNNGNYASAIRTFNVTNTAKDQPVWIEAKDPNADKILLGSLYWVNVKAQNAASVSSVDVDLDLDNLSKWQLDHMEVAEGFDASYEIVNADENIACLTITRNSDDIALLDGDALVSMPIRTWELPAVVADGAGHIGSVWMYPNYRAGNEVWPVSVILNVSAGKVTFSDNSTDIFIGDEVSARTESIYWDNDNAKASDAYYTSWNGGHDHRAETAQYYAEGNTNHVDAVAVEDLAPTCTKPGYTGRTYCEVCNSIVDWGTEVPATGHHYEVIDGVLKCKDCGEIFDGVFEEDGRLYEQGVKAEGWRNENTNYYADGYKVADAAYIIGGETYIFDADGAVIAGASFDTYSGFLYDLDNDKIYNVLNGTKLSGWKGIDKDWYYFDDTTKAAVVGEFTDPDSNVTFTFGNDGKLLHGEWAADENGTRYYYGPDFYRSSRFATVNWAVIDGNTYGFNGDGYRYEGIAYTRDSNAPQYLNEFTDEGVYVGKFSGIHHLKYYVDGVLAPVNKLIEVDGDYYYVKGNATLATGNYLVANGNGIVENNTYHDFDNETGKMLPDPVKNGIVEDEDGVLRYYVNDELQKLSLLIEIDGDYYYVRSNGALAIGRYCVWNGNGIVPDQSYQQFGEDGKMVIIEPEPVKDGIVRDDDGVLRYYADGELQKLSLLIEIDGDYYYVRSNGALAIGRYCVWNGNGFVEDKSYHNFDENGKMEIIEPEPIKNGIIRDEDGVLRYYINGELQKGLGLIEIDGSYYYVRTYGEVATGRYLVWYGNNIVADQTYHNFADDGKMID